MMVMVPVRLAGRKTVRPVSSEYFSKIWSTGALKNLRKCSARSACPSAAALVVAAEGVVGGGEMAGGAAAWPATLTPGFALGAAVVAAPGTGGTGTATRFVRAGGIGRLYSALVLASGILVGPGAGFVAAAGELVTPGRGWAALAASFVAVLGAWAGACASICAAQSERSRRE